VRTRFVPTDYSADRFIELSIFKNYFTYSAWMLLDLSVNCGELSIDDGILNV